MSQKFIGEEEFKDYKLKIFWGRPPEYAEYSRDICTIHVLTQDIEDIIFTEQTHISLIAEKEAKGIVEDLYHEILKDQLTEDNVIGNFVVTYTVNKVKEKIKLGNFEEGASYKDEIMTGTTDIESWVHDMSKLFD